MLKYFVNRSVLLFIFFLIGVLTNAQQSLFLEKGVVQDSLLVTETKQYFSLYIPKDYNKGKSWPVIIGFDTKNKAGEITKLFKNSAEELGYIVAVLNISNKDSLKQKKEKTKGFVDHVFSLFSVDTNQLYVTGLEQGSVYASLLPGWIDKNIAGVIAMDDSYFYDVHTQFKKNTSYIGIVSRYNLKRREFLDNNKYLNRKSILADVYEYESKLMIPDQKLLRKALITFSLHGMVKGRIPKDSVFIYTQYLKGLKEADNYLQNKDFIRALEEVKRTQDLYGNFFNTDTLKVKQKEIKNIKEYKKQKRQWSKYNYREQLLRDTYIQSLEEDVDFIEYENLGWWNYQVSELDSLIKNNEIAIASTAYRLKEYVKLTVNTLKTSVLKEGNTDQILFLHILSTIIDPKDYNSYRKIISFSAQDQDNETALFYLEKMLKKGYTDFESLYNIDGTLALRLSKKYNELIKKYLGKAKYHFSE